MSTVLLFTVSRPSHVRFGNRKIVRYLQQHRWCAASRRQSMSYEIPPPPIQHTVDTLIIGAGPIGASTAYHLAKKRIGGGGGGGDGLNEAAAAGGFDPSILVVERDPTCNSGSAVFSAGGIRLQFSLQQNVQMSLYGIDFLRQSKTNLTLTESHHEEPIDIQYVENGYLFLASTDDGARQLKLNHDMYTQLECGDMVQLLQPTDIKARFPWINVNDVILASHGVSGEGWFDPWTFIHGLNEKNKEMGVRYINGTVVGASRDTETGKIISIQIQEGASSSSNQIHTINVGTVVNAAGAVADVVLGSLAGVEKPLTYRLPVRPRKRSVYFFNCDAEQVHDDDIVPAVAPLTIDHSGAYFRSEGVVPGTGNFLCGISPPKDEDNDCYDREELANADPDLFEERIWPALYNRVPAFGSIKVKSSWAGLYEYNIVDQNCILDFHPEMNNVLMVNGFSGHGLQHSPAAGLAAAELIDDENNFMTIDLNVFRFDRIIDDKPVFERGIY
jgi:FAD-dependent oxidoreductase domain-containing protein 1